MLRVVPPFRSRPSALSNELSPKERKLLAATVGSGRYRVVARWPLTVALGPYSWMPGLAGALIALLASHRHGIWFGLGAAGVAGATMVLSLAVHEAGHLLSSRAVRGVSPRMLLMRSSGGVSIVEGRFKDARGAALFAAGGPIATILLTTGLIAAGLLLPSGPLGVGLLVTALLNVMMLAVNLLPVAPTDGYALFRSAVWAETGSRDEAERRAIEWSRVVLASGLTLAMFVLVADHVYGMLAIVVLVTLTVQHHAAAGRADRVRAGRSSSTPSRHA